MPMHQLHRMAFDFGSVAAAPTLAQRAWQAPLASGLAERTVVALHSGAAQNSHDAVSRRNVARRLASYLGYGFDLERTPNREGSPYLVPADALLLEEARELGVHDRDDLFGGVVPQPFVATKSIVHPLGSPDAFAPAGWSAAFTTAVRPVVLDGETAFSRKDAVASIDRMLRGGVVRLKRATGIGGRGQFVVRGVDEGRAALASLDEGELAEYGVVVEQNLSDVTTFSVGQVEVGGVRASYWGTQRTVRNHAGHEVYGGSTLHVARGGFPELLALAMPEDARRAVEQSWCFDEAAAAHYPGLMASRRNYDVAFGRDSEGGWRSGVLEQSWRIGGASAAEVLALEVLRGDPACPEVCASTVESYGIEPVPDHAFVYYDGDDGRGGRLRKFAYVEGNADA